jgi:hypothetical protein
MMREAPDLGLQAAIGCVEFEVPALPLEIISYLEPVVSLPDLVQGLDTHLSS